MIEWDARKISDAKWNRVRTKAQVATDEIMFQGKIVPIRGGYQVELRSNRGQACILMVIALDGWEMKHESRERKPYTYQTTRGHQLRFSLNSALWADMDFLQQCVDAGQEAKRVLEALQDEQN